MRHEFSKATRKAALARSGGVCEASGRVYGLKPETRCTALLSQTGVQYDHYPLPAHAENSATVENCVCCCPACHLHKTRTFDVPAEAKIKRVRRKHGPPDERRRTKHQIKTRGFSKGQSRPLQGRPFQRRPSP